MYNEHLNKWVCGYLYIMDLYKLVLISPKKGWTEGQNRSIIIIIIGSLTEVQRM